MKRILTALLLLCVVSVSYGQTFTAIHNAQAIDWISGVKYLQMPYGATAVLNATRVTPGALFFSTTDSLVRVWTGTQFITVGTGSGGSTDTTHLSDRINALARITLIGDTTARIRQLDDTTFQTYNDTSQADNTALVTQYQLSQATASRPAPVTLQQATNNSIDAALSPWINARHNTFVIDSLSGFGIFSRESDSTSATLEISDDDKQAILRVQNGPVLGAAQFQVSGNKAQVLVETPDKSALLNVSKDFVTITYNESDSAGIFGIGTFNPLAPLHVVGDGTLAALFMNGNVGIGTIAPDSKLNIIGQNTNNNISLLSGNSTSSYNDITWNLVDNSLDEFGSIYHSENPETGVISNITNGGATQSSIYSQFAGGVGFDWSINSNSALRIDNIGNMGIGGITAPTSKLDVAGLISSDGLLIKDGSDITFNNAPGNNAAINTGQGALAVSNVSNGSFDYADGSITVKGGLVGIGTATPITALDINGTTKTINYYTASTTPGISAGAGAGTSPTVSIVSGTNSGGTINITTGTLPSLSSTIATITFSDSFAFPNGCSVVLYPANANAAALSGAQMVFTNGSTSTWTITSGTTGLTGGTAFIFNYKVEGY